MHWQHVGPHEVEQAVGKLTPHLGAGVLALDDLHRHRLHAVERCLVHLQKADPYVITRIQVSIRAVQRVDL